MKKQTEKTNLYWGVVRRDDENCCVAVYPTKSDIPYVYPRNSPYKIIRVKVTPCRKKQ